MSSSSNIQKSLSSSASTDQTKVKESSIEKTHVSTNPKLTETFNDLLKFPLMDAIAGRRSFFATLSNYSVILRPSINAKEFTMLKY